MPALSSALALAQVIDDSRDAIIKRWLERVCTEIAGAPKVERALLRDGLPDYLAALVRLLRTEEAAPDPLSCAMAAWARVAREHGITRVRLGFDIAQLVHEFIVLRQSVRQICVEKQLAHDAEAEAILADAIEAAISVAVHSYVETRDFETRRRQAEHVGFLTHELRNPLSTAMLASQKLRSSASTKEGELLDLVDKSHRRLTELINSVLHTEKLEAGKVEPHRVRVRLGTLMEAALEAARSIAAEKRIGFHVSYDDADVEIDVDPELTRSAIQNVADNAVRYTDAGDVHIDVKVLADKIVVHVRDSCPGLSPEELATIFEPFERGRTGKAGTGLGLAIALRSIEAQGGSIHAESPDDSGCHFSIELPR